MDFADVVRKRRMVRNFTPEAVDLKAIDRVLELARRGPSAGFTQGQAFVVVTDAEVKRKIATLCGEEHYVEGGFAPFISRAPVVVVPCTSERAYHRRYQEPDKLDESGKEIDWPVPYWFMDVGCAVMTVLLGAVNEGLAAGFAGSWDLDALRTLLSIPQEFTPVGVIPIGHPAPDLRSPSLKRGRKPQKEAIHHGRW